MTWTSLTFNFGSLLTSSKMTQLSDNITALANGDSGAPTVKAAALGNPSPGGLPTYAFQMPVESYSAGGGDRIVGTPGTIRVRGGYRIYGEFSDHSGGSVYVKFWVNSAQVGTTQTVESAVHSPVYYDVTSAAEGDRLWLTVNIGSTYGRTRNCCLAVNSLPLLAPYVPIAMVTTP